MGRDAKRQRADNGIFAVSRVFGWFATGITVVNTSNTSVTGTVVGLAVATGTATLLFHCFGT